MERLAILPTSDLHAVAPDRVAIVEVSEEMLVALGQAGIEQAIRSALPGDAILIDAGYDPPCLKRWLKYRSGSFPMVPAGGPIPIIDSASWRS